jgi:tetratricopeptide (TPR) repeat protein
MSLKAYYAFGEGCFTVRMKAMGLRVLRRWRTSEALSAFAISAGISVGAGACARGPNSGAVAPSHELESERRLQYLVATPAAVLPDLASATKENAEPVGADEKLQHWVKRNMRGFGLTVVGDSTDPHDVELRLAVESRGVGRLTRGRAAMQVIAGDRVLSQWSTDEHVESAHGFDPALAQELVAKLASSPRVAKYADSLYGERVRPLTETVGRRAYVPEYGGTPPMEVLDETGPSPMAKVEMPSLPKPSAEDIAAAAPIATKGNELYAAGKFADAYGQFEEAFILSQDAALVYEMGECQRNLGNAADALGFYRDYLRRAPDGVKAADAASHVRDLAPPSAK